MSNRIKIIWLCPEFTPYHDLFFAALAADRRVELHVIIMMGATQSHPFENQKERPYVWEMANPKVRVDRALIGRLLAGEKKTCFVVSSYLKPTLLAIMKALARAGRPFLYFTDTPLPQKVRWTDKGPEKRSWLRRFARQRRLNWIFHHAHRVLATGDFGVKAVEQLGCPPAKSVVFPYWVDVGPVPPPRDRSQPAYRFLAIGQLIHR